MYNWLPDNERRDFLKPFNVGIFIYNYTIYCANTLELRLRESRYENIQIIELSSTGIYSVCIARNNSEARVDGCII